MGDQLKSKNRAVGYLIAANFETLFIIIGVRYMIEWLDYLYPIEIGWTRPLVAVGIFAICNKWYKLGRLLYKASKEQS